MRSNNVPTAPEVRLAEDEAQLVHTIFGDDVRITLTASCATGAVTGRKTRFVPVLTSVLLQVWFRQKWDDDDDDDNARPSTMVDGEQQSAPAKGSPGSSGGITLGFALVPDNEEETHVIASLLGDDRVPATLAAPQFHQAASSSLSLASVSEVVNTVESCGAGTSTVVGSDADGSAIEWTSEGWLVGLLSAAQSGVVAQEPGSSTSGNTELKTPSTGSAMGARFGTNGGLGRRTFSTLSNESTDASLAAENHPLLHDVLAHLQSRSAPATAPLAGTSPTKEAYSSATPQVIATVRVYRLEHMRKPGDYVKTLHSWFDAEAFVADHGFATTLIAADGSHRVFVGFLHLELVTVDAPRPHEPTSTVAQSTSSSTKRQHTGPSSHTASPSTPSSGGDEPGSTTTSPDITTLERMWRTIPVDIDKQGKPCVERLSRVVIDARRVVDCKTVITLLKRRAPWMRAGAPLVHALIGLGNAGKSGCETLEVPQLDRATIAQAFASRLCLAALPGVAGGESTTDAPSLDHHQDALVPRAAVELGQGILWS